LFKKQLGFLFIDVAKMSDFQWNKKRGRAALLLAEGYKNGEVAQEIGICERTLYRWKEHSEFSAEIDRLTHMVGISLRAERLRIAMRVVRSKLQYSLPATEKDLLDWLKYAQSETDGAKLDLTSLLEAVAQVAGGGSTGVDPE